MTYANMDSTSDTNEYGDKRSGYKPKLLIVGYARHGKDTVGEILRDEYGFKFTSSSMFVAQEVMWDNWGCAVYDNFDEMFEDRINNRVLWMQMISAYNTPDKTKTAHTMIERGYDMYVGMRRLDELEACRERGFLDAIVWVDASDRKPPETGSMDITRENAKPDYVIDNNGSLEDLYANVHIFACDFLGISPPTATELNWSGWHEGGVVTGRTPSDYPNFSAQPKVDPHQNRADAEGISRGEAKRLNHMDAYSK